jgi:BirA family biotin operon repressor/biotin-[acetyl-CoA-carboxylase] ligase
MQENFDIDEIQRRLQTPVIGRKVVFLKKTISTNRDAMQLAGEGAGDGTVVIADEQTGGRGRFDRTWLSPAGKNILMSVVLRPRIDLGRVFQLTMIASLGVTHAVKSVTGIEALIKWPNDVYIRGKKVCGILTEISTSGVLLSYAVVGIGVNVNAHPELDDPRAVPATSIAREAGKEISRSEIILRLVEEMDRRYRMLTEGAASSILDDWNRQSLVLGKRVAVSDLEGSIEGTAESVDEEGRLMLRDDDGMLRKITSGDVTLRV